MSLFLELIVVALCMLIIKTRNYSLDITVVTTENECAISFTESGKNFVLSLQYNGGNSVLFVNAVKMRQFKGND